jgi:hypothetical protein
MRDFSHIVTAGVGPIIVISAAGLLCLAFYNRLTAVVTRLRGFDRERLQEQDAIDKHGGPEGDPALVAGHLAVLAMLREQIELVKRRAHLVRRTLVCLHVTIISLALCSLVVGLGTVWPGLHYAAVPLFVIGLLSLVLSCSFALLELHMALAPIEMEARFVSQLTQR